MSRVFILSFEDNAHRISYKQYFLLTVEIKDYNIMTNGKKFFDQKVKNDLKTNHSLRKFAASLGDDYTTGCLLDYKYFKNYYKIIAIVLSKQQAFDADLKVLQRIDFTGTLGRAGNATMFFIIEETK